MKFKSLVLLSLFSIGLGIFASDHKEAPLVDEQLPADIADLYVFLNPDDASELVLVMTVNPFSVPAEARAFNPSPRVRYRFHIDNDGDASKDLSVLVRIINFDTFEAVFPGDIKMQGQVTRPTVNATPFEPIINTSDDGTIKVFVGPRDDPFFFDFVGFSRFLNGTGGFNGNDSFANFNVTAIVVAFPVSMVQGGSSVFSVWAATEENSFRGFKNKTAARSKLSDHVFWKQIDRVGNPGVATALIPAELKDRYNVRRPAFDAEEFAPHIVASLQALGTDDENIGILASVAVPDQLTIDVSQPVGFPNGRDLDDDVIDTLLFFIFNQVAVSDGVDANEVPFLTEFPYLAPPWQPE